VRQTREHTGELVDLDRLVVHEEVAAASGAVLREMHERACTVVDVNRRYPSFRGSELKHRSPRHDRFDDALAKPRAVAVDPPGQCGDDRQPGHDVSVETIEGGPEASFPSGRAWRFVFGDR